MDNKVRSALEKALQDKTRGNHQKALKRLTDTIEKFPGEPELYFEAADVCLEGGESLQATQFLRRAQSKFSSERDRLSLFARDKVRELNDAVLGKFVVEQAIKKRDLDDALDCLGDLQDRACRDLLQRTRTKKQSLTAASHGGYSLTGEMMTNAMSEALLCIRLGRMKEAVRGLLLILEEKPVENETIQPFLGRLEKIHPKSGRIKYGHACSLLLMNELDGALARFITAARVEPAVADDCLERIREYAAEHDSPPEDIERGHVELLLIKGDVDQAVEILERQLEEDPKRASEIIEQIKPHVEIHRDAIVLHYLYMDAALLAEQTLRVLETLKILHQEEENRPNLLEWLATRGKERFLAPEILIFQAEMAIDQKEVEQAVDLLRAVAHNSPPDAPTVARILEKYRTMDERFAQLLTEVAGEQEKPAGGDGLEFEHFENTEFSFSAEGGKPAVEEEPEPASPVEAEVDTEVEEEDAVEADPDFDNFSGRSIFARTNAEAENQDDNGAVEGIETSGGNGFSSQPESPAQTPDMDSFEKSTDFAGSGAIVWDEEDESGTPELPPTATEPIIPRRRPTLIDLDEADEDTPVAQQEPATEPEIDEREVEEPEVSGAEPESPSWPVLELSGEHVQAVAYELCQSGAATFFHIEAPEEAEPEEPEVTAEPEPVEEPEEPEVTAEPEPVEEPEEPEVTAEPEPVEEPEEPEVTAEPEPVEEPEEPEVTAEPEPVEEPEEPDDEERFAAAFDERFQKFVDGELDNAAVLELIEEALDRGNEAALEELLYFHPSDPAEEFLRECFRMEYHLLGNRPRAALALVEAMDISRLEGDDRRKVLMKKVACHRTMDEFEAAHDVLVGLVEEFPDDDEIGRLAKQNYEQYLNDQCNDAAVLERTSSLTTDL